MRIISELMLFGRAVIWGVCVDAVYSLVKVFRLYIRHNVLFIGIEDFLYCVLTAAVLFKNIFDQNDGIIRWYILFAVIFGMWINYVTAGRFFVKISSRLSDRIKGILGKISIKCRHLIRLIMSKALKNK